MKRHEILGITFVILVVAGFGTLTIQSLPKRLDPPVRFVQEATATGVVSRVTPKGIEIRFADGKKRFFRATGFTNGQSVRVEVRVDYVLRDALSAGGRARLPLGLPKPVSREVVRSPQNARQSLIASFFKSGSHFIRGLVEDSSLQSSILSALRFLSDHKAL